jgi:hypothetical protein
LRLGEQSSVPALQMGSEALPGESV